MYDTTNFLHVHELIVLFQRESMCVDSTLWEGRWVWRRSYFIGTMNPSWAIDRDCFRCSSQTMTSLRMNRPLLNCLRRAHNAYFVLFSLFFLVNTTVLFHICSLYRGYFWLRDQKKRSMFRVERCSLYRGLFTAKIRRGDRSMRSHGRCSLYRGVH